MYSHTHVLEKVKNKVQNPMSELLFHYITGIPCFIALPFSVLHRYCLFINIEPRLSVKLWLTEGSDEFTE